MNGFKKIIENKNLSYASISKLTGISERSIERYANGDVKPTWENALKIIKIFHHDNIDFYKFFG